MSKEYNKTITIQNETLIGKFPVENYDNCNIIFQNCTFIGFDFHSNRNSIEFQGKNTFCETIYLEAYKIIIKENIDTNNLNSLSIHASFLKIREGMEIKGAGDIRIISDMLSLQNNKIESMTDLMIQSSIEASYQNCIFTGKNGVKITTLRGNLKLENSKVEVTDSRMKEYDDEKINGAYISCYGALSHMYLLNSIIKTDVLEINHPNYMVVKNTELQRAREYGRFLSRNQENIIQVFNYNYIEEETPLEQFYKPIEEEKKGKSKILELFGFKKSA